MAVEAVSQHRKRASGWSVVLAAYCALQAAPAAGGETPRTPELHIAIVESTRRFGDTAQVERATLVAAILDSSRLARPDLSRNFRLEITPLLKGIMRFVREAGVPVRAVEDSSARHLVGVSASFKMREDLPAVTCYARDSSPELFGAFYPVRRGVTWAVVWPLQRFTLRLQGGDDSEFGSFAIAGVEWRATAQRLALGMGVPMNLHNSKGGLGGIVQLRMKFD